MNQTAKSYIFLTLHIRHAQFKKQFSISLPAVCLSYALNTKIFPKLWTWAWWLCLNASLEFHYNPHVKFPSLFSKFQSCYPSIYFQMRSTHKKKRTSPWIWLTDFCTTLKFTRDQKGSYYGYCSRWIQLSHRRVYIKTTGLPVRDLS